MTWHLRSIKTVVVCGCLAVALFVYRSPSKPEATPIKQIQGTWIVTSINQGANPTRADASFFQSFHLQKLANGLVFRFEDDSTVVVLTGEGFEMKRGRYLLSEDGKSLVFQYQTKEQSEYSVQFHNADSLLIVNQEADGKKQVLGFRRSKS